MTSRIPGEPCAKNSVGYLRYVIPEKPESGRAARGYDTNNDTKPEAMQEEIPQVVENMVELVGLEPTTSSLRTMRSPS